MRIFQNKMVDLLIRRLVPGVAVLGLAGWGIAYGGPTLENVPGLIPMADAVDLGIDSASSTSANPLAAAQPGGQGGTSSDAFTDGTYQDGTYTGTAKGWGGNITVKVTITDGKIAAIDIVSASAETASYLARAKGVISSILAKQTPNVDVVSGATYSSNGIINAVKRALTVAAGGTPSSVDDSTTPGANATPSTPSKPEAFTDGTYKDGTYTGTAEGWGGDITVKVTISGGKITAVDIVSAKSETASYLAQAKGVISKVLEKQSPNVDVVSGATYSSNGILNAIKRALTVAAGQPDPEPAAPSQPETPELPAITIPEPSENTEVEDIVYTVDVPCSPDEFEDFDAYNMTVAITVRQATTTETQSAVAEDGSIKTTVKTTVTRMISDISITNPDSTSSNWSYIVWALDGRGSASGLKAQAIAKQTFEGLDAVTRATCSSVSIMEAGQKLSGELALGTTVTEEDVQ